MQANRVFHVHGRRGNLFRGLVAAGAGAALVMSAAPPAAAVPGRTGYGIEISGVTAWGTTWLGPVIGTADAEVTGWYSWCITAGYDAPDGMPAAGAYTLNDPQLAWIIGAKEAEARTDSSGVAAAAISYGSHIRHETGTASVSAAARIAAFVDNTPQIVKDKWDAYLAEATAQAGPYRAGGAAVDGSGTRSGLVHVDPVVSDSGTPVVGLPLTVTLDNSQATFDATGSTTWTGTSSTQRISLAWTAQPGANGDVDWTYSYGDLPRYTLTRLTAAGAVQDTLTHGLRGPADPEEIETSGPVFRAVGDFQPTLGSSVEAFHVVPGEQLVDIVHVGIEPGDAWAEPAPGAPVTLQGVDRFYGPFATPPAQSAGVPADAPLAAEVPFAVSGVGDVRVIAPEMPGGYYVAVPSIRKSDQDASVRDFLRADATHDFGVPAQTAVVPFQPMGTSDITDSKVVDVGQPYTDQLEVFAAPGHVWPQVTPGDDVDVLFEGTAYSVGIVPPSGQQAEVPPGAPVLGTATILADGPGDYAATFPGVPAGQIGTIVWEAVRDRQPAPEWIAGDWTDGWGLELETFSVRHDTTEVDSELGTRETRNGTYLVDDIWQYGLPADHPDFPGGYGFGSDTPTVEHTAYFFAEHLAVTDENLPEALSLGTVPIRAANGFYPSVGSTTWKIQTDEDGRDIPGTYVVVSSLTQDDRVTGWVSSATDKYEQFRVQPDPEDPLAATTQVQTDQSEFEEGATATLWDEVIVTGTVPEGATYESALYHWEGETPLCSPETLVDPGAPLPLPGPGTFPTDAVTVEALAAGSYGYAETVRDADGAVLGRGECGASSETLHTGEVVPEEAVSSEVLSAPDDVLAAFSNGVLATTGAQASAVGLAALVLLATGAGIVVWWRRLDRSLTQDAGER